MEKNLSNKFCQRWRGFPACWKWAALICALVAVPVVAVICRNEIACYLGYYASANPVMSVGARFLRDFAVGYAAIIGIGLAAWRNYNFDRQAKAATDSYSLAESRALSERFATATKLLAEETAGQKPAVAARVSGIYIMEELASEAHKTFLFPTLKTLVAYIKDNARITATPPLPDKLGEIPIHRSVLGEDVKAAFAVIQTLRVKCEEGELPHGAFPPPSVLDFSRANFSHLDLHKEQVAACFGMFRWHNADLSGADLREASLSDADFTGAILHGANLSETSLVGANLSCADLSGANLGEAKIYSNTQLKGADLSWASMRKAYLEIDDWTAVRFYETDFSRAKIAKPLTAEDKKSIRANVFHNNHPDLHDVPESIGSWQLNARSSTSALVGAFRNFSGIEKSEEFQVPFEMAKSFREHIRYLQRGEERWHNLPSDFPKEWLEWLDSMLEDDM